MSLLSGSLFARKKLPRSSSVLQDSGKGPVIGNFFSTTLSPTTPASRDVIGAMDGKEASYLPGNMDSDIIDGLNAAGDVLGVGSVAHVAGGDGSGGPLDSIEPKDVYGGVPANYMMDIFNDTSNSTFGLLDGLNNYSFLLDCDNSTADAAMCIFNNGSIPTTAEPLGLPEHSYWVLFLIFFPFLTVFGNVLVVLSVYRERSLRHVTNYFICSLAIADILVAVIVMPPAVFMEVTKYWSMSDELCDAWVAFDVMACTASILNLTAISVDRFIAVTQPIKYAKHKNSKRVHVMLALTWVVSIAIAAPIALGVNYSSAREPGSCSFFNSDFLIYSSMGSFYIPSLMMIFLYWRIYRVLRIRAQKSMANKKARSIDTQTLHNVIENAAAANTTEPTDKTGLATTMDNGKLSTYNTNATSTTAAGNNCNSAAGNHQEAHHNIADEPSTSNPPTNTDSQEKDEDDDEEEESGDSKSPVHLPPQGDTIANPVAEDLDKREQLAARKTMSGNGGKVPQVAVTIKETNEMETHFSAGKCGGKDDNQDDNSSSKQTSNDSKERRKKEKKNVTKFNFHMRTSRKRKERSSSRRERKATKTLAIVLGVFLLCWWPFFTVNIMRAICLRYEVLNYPKCDIDGNLMGFFVWLGYINSFLNPVIYTIFNPEFRKAFKKILAHPCPARY